MVASNVNSDDVDMDHLYVGERFTQLTEPKGTFLDNKVSFKKSIIPTKSIFQVGLHMSGACKVDHPWNGCEKNSTAFCYTRNISMADNSNGYHFFDQSVTAANVKNIDSASEGVLYHVMYFRLYFSPSHEIDLSIMNDYAAKYFPNTLKALRKRRLDVLIETPKFVTEVPSVADSWVDYELVYNSRGTLGSLFPGYGDTLRRDKVVR